MGQVGCGPQCSGSGQEKWTHGQLCENFASSTEMSLVSVKKDKLAFLSPLAYIVQLHCGIPAYSVENAYGADISAVGLHVSSPVLKYQQTLRHLCRSVWVQNVCKL